MERTVFLIGLGISLSTAFTGVWLARSKPIEFNAPTTQIHHLPEIQAPDLTKPLRKEPARFLARTHLPARKEELVSGPPNSNSFFRQFDLIRIDDRRVWWESDNDVNDVEDDHLIHASMEEPLKRLIELVTQASGTLKVHDTYRAEGIHSTQSLHREGRAVDITCDELGLEKLSKLSWAAGFDWVYHEVPRRGGAHVHASVRSDRARLRERSVKLADHF